MDTSWKFSRISAAATVAAAHVLLVFLLAAVLAARTEPEGPSVEPLLVKLENRPARLPAPPAPRSIAPALAKIRIRLPQAPDLQIQIPTEAAVNNLPSAPVVGSSGAGGPIEQPGGSPSPLTVIHYVAPRYPERSARRGEHGEIGLALRIDTDGNVDQVRILHSTGISRLDKSAVSAVRQWKFAPIQSAAVWGSVQLGFAPAQHIFGVPLIEMPYAAVAHQIDTQIGANPAAVMQTPAAETAVHRLLGKLVTAFPDTQSRSAAGPGESIEAEVADRGQIHSVRFMGFISDGISFDDSDSPPRSKPPTTHWEVYDVEQARGVSVWVVEAKSSGVIQQIEVAMR